MSAAKYGVEQDFSEAGIIIAPVYASKAALVAAGYTTGGSLGYAAGAFWGRDASSYRELMFRDGAGGADYIPVSDSSGIYQATTKSSLLPSFNYWAKLGANLNHTSGNISVGTTASNATAHLRGAGSTAATSVMILEDSTGNYNFRFYDDGSVLHVSTAATIGTYGDWTTEVTRAGGATHVIRNNNSGSAAYTGLVLNAYGNSWGVVMGSAANNSNALDFNLNQLGTPALQMRLNSTGLGVGISPAYKLDISGTSRVSGAALFGGTMGITGATTLNNYMIQNVTSGASTYFMQVVNGVNLSYFGSGAGNGMAATEFLHYIYGSGDYHLAVGGATRFRIRSSGVLNVPGYTTSGSLIQVGSGGDLAQVSPYDFSGTLTAARAMTLGTNTFTFDASGASASTTTVIQKGRTTGITRIRDIQDGAGTAQFREELNVTSSLIALNALNAYALKFTTASGGGEIQFAPGGTNQTRLLIDGTFRRPQLVGNPATILQGSEWFDISAVRPAWSIGTTSGDVRHAASVERDLIGNSVVVITTSSNTIGGANHNYRFDANSGSIANTLGADLDEGVEYLFRCTANGTNTVTFNADTGNSYVFYVDTVSSTTSTTLVAGGAGGTGITAPYKIYFVRRIGTVIFIS